MREARQRLRADDGHRWTQGDLAAAVGVERNTVSRWENGGVRPKDPVQFARLARVLRVSTDWLLGASGAVSAAPAGSSTARFNEGSRRGYRGDADASAAPLPADVTELLTGYLDRLDRAGCTRDQVAGAESLLVAAARNAVASTPLDARDPDDVIADVDAAWDLVVRILRRDGLRP